MLAGCHYIIYYKNFLLMVFITRSFIAIAQCPLRGITKKIQKDLQLPPMHFLTISTFPFRNQPFFHSNIRILSFRFFIKIYQWLWGHFCEANFFFSTIDSQKENDFCWPKWKNPPKIYLKGNEKCHYFCSKMHWGKL